MQLILFDGLDCSGGKNQLFAFGITEMVKKGCSLDHLEGALQHALESSATGKTLPNGKG